MLGVAEDPIQLEENAVLWAMFGRAPMFSMLEFFKNYRCVSPSLPSPHLM